DFVANGTARFNKAFEIQQQNLGVRGRVALEQFRQYFLVKFGLPIQRGLVQIAEYFGGAGRAIDKMIVAGRNLLVFGASWRVSSSLIVAYNNQVAASAANGARQNAIWAMSFRGLSFAQAGATFGISLLVTGVAEL